MIIDKLTNSSTYERMHPLFKQAFDHIKSIGLDDFSVGTVELMGRTLYVVSQQYDTRPSEEGKWESHRRYIDIQFILEGEELMNTAFVSDMVLGEYLEEKDFQKAEGKGEPIVVKAGEFAVFYPQDMHMPCLRVAAPSQVKKIVCKVAVEG